MDVIQGAKQFVAILPPTEVIDSENLMRFIDSSTKVSENYLVMPLPK
jgi:hypothetical protein